MGRVPLCGRPASRSQPAPAANRGGHRSYAVRMNDSPLSPPVLVDGNLGKRSPGLLWALLALVVVWAPDAGRPRRYRGECVSVRTGLHFGQG